MFSQSYVHLFNMLVFLLLFNFLYCYICINLSYGFVHCFLPTFVSDNYQIFELCDTLVGMTSAIQKNSTCLIVTVYNQFSHPSQVFY